ncbi:MAG: DUF3857 domain-containing protein, partial [Bacteroidetes bacterium]|nr:DUF3857 domain-containing protein [Bacteroidota bacterium]
MKKFFFLSLLIPGFAIAQDYNLSEFIWEENPVREILEPGLLKEHFIILHEKRILEYAFDQEDELSLFETYHKKVRVNDDGAIQRFNKVYISLSDVVDIIDIKARTITKEGKIIEVDKASIKELVNLGDYGDYKIFAIEGLEKESDLEYFYKLKKKVVFYERMYMQSDGHIGNSELSIITPEYLIFKTKSYNGYPMLKDTIVDGKRIMAGTVKNIPPLNEEKYAAYRSNLMRVDIKFSYNAID